MPALKRKFSKSRRVRKYMHLSRKRKTRRSQKGGAGGILGGLFSSKKPSGLTGQRPPNTAPNTFENTSPIKSARNLTASGKGDEPVVKLTEEIKKGNTLILKEIGQKLLRIIEREENTGKPEKTIVLPESLTSIINWVKAIKQGPSEFKKAIRDKFNTLKLKLGFKPRSPFTKGETALTDEAHSVEDATGIMDTLTAEDPQGVTEETETQGVNQTISTTCPITATEEYQSTQCKENPYLQYAFAGNIQQILTLFLERYEENKIRARSKLTPNKKLAFYLGFAIVSCKALLNTAKLSASLFAGIATFGVGGGLIYGIIDNMHKLVISTSGTDVYFNSTAESLQLMSPHKLWKDPELKDVLLIVANAIRVQPELLEALPGYNVELQRTEPKKYTKFVSISNEYGDTGCNNHTEKLNVIFSGNLSDPLVQNLIISELHFILVSSALWIKNENPNLITQLARGAGFV